MKLRGIGLLLSLAMATANAATLYKWVDENGNVTYQDTPPPENVLYEESTVDAPPAPLPEDTSRGIEEAALANPVSLYTVPQCDTCDLVRMFLERHSVPFAEKDVRNNIEMQAELEQAVGSLTVPTLTVGDRVLDGYSSNAIRSALLEAGFPIVDARSSDGTADEDTTDSEEEPFSEESDELEGFSESEGDETATDTQ